VAGPWITDREVSQVAAAVRSAWYNDANEPLKRFEAAFAEYVGRHHAIGLPSCTSGLHLALAALGIGPGDEVIVPDITWIATSAPIHYVGAEPVFVDIDAASWCMDAASLAAAVTSRTKAIMVVDLYGNMPDMASIAAIAARQGVPLIEDAAQAIGARFDGRPAGCFGIASCFSFHGSKTLTTGEGGMLVTDDEALYARCLQLRDHGRKPGDTMFLNEEIGFKYRMSALQAALGLAQLERIDELVGRKREIFAMYRDALAGIPGLTLNSEAPRVHNAYWMVTVTLDPSLGVRKEKLIETLRAKGIDSRPFFHPLSALPAYADMPAARGAAARNRVAYALAPWGVNLPSALCLERADVKRVSDAIRSALGS
jgi:perosamine synthetase